jgi:hypothetical protein
MTDPNDMEDPQAGEVLPPMLHDLFWERAISFDGELKVLHFKAGMECVYQALKPLMQAALPHYEAGLPDTRVGQENGQKLGDLAQFKEIVEYGNGVMNE